MAVKKVWIGDDDDCTVCGVCSDLCPDVFLMSEDEGTTSIIEEADIADSSNCIIDAASNCPVEIIKYEE